MCFLMCSSSSPILWDLVMTRKMRHFRPKSPGSLWSRPRITASARPRLSDHAQRFVSYSQLVRFVKLDGKFMNGRLSLLDPPRCRAVFRADQKDRGRCENVTNDAANSYLWCTLSKNSFILIIIIVIVIVIIIIIIIIVIVLSCFYLQGLIKIVKHAYERNDSAAFWKVIDALIYFTW